jgi:predicted HTH domain antitoxin
MVARYLTSLSFVEADEFLFGIEVSLEATVVHIEIPRKVLYAARMTASELQRELAVHLFAEGTLSFGKGREVANMCFWEFQQLLAQPAHPRTLRHRGIRRRPCRPLTP